MRAALPLLALLAAPPALADATPPAGAVPKPLRARPSCWPQSGPRLDELDLNGDKKPDLWKSYATGADGVRVLVCKVMDLNFDGRIDSWIHYDARGDVTLEEFDLDFDGNIDTTTIRRAGKILRQELDTNGDGKVDLWKFFDDEKLQRIERASKPGGRVDVWEYYVGGKLDRIGYDTRGTGTADRWEHAPESK